MRLYLMRHGEATNKAQADAERPLTDGGRQDVADMFDRFKQDLLCVEAIWTSPYRRAQQTADIASSTFGKSVITQNSLTPAGNPKEVMAQLRELSQPVLLISHQPLVGTLLDMLAGLEPGRYRMGTSSIACVEMEVVAASCADLCWLHHPISE